MSGRPVLVTGAAGFIGAAVARRLTAEPDGLRLRLLVHRTPPAVPAGPDVRWVMGDLADRASLAAACQGVDTVLHLASCVDDDPVRCDAVNGAGTEALVAAAQAAGAGRLVYVSSAAVYGFAVHRGASETEAVVAPATPVSRSRARAERAVLAAGGIVLRPLFVYGDGDTRFIPKVIRATRKLPFLVSGGRARLSVVSANDLAVVIGALASLPAAAWRPGAYHVTDGSPIPYRQLVEMVARTLGLRMPRLDVPYGVARTLLSVTGRRVLGAAGWSASAAHRLFLVTHDHWYDDEAIRRLVGVGPTAPFAERFAESAGWYRRFLAPVTT